MKTAIKVFVSILGIGLIVALIGLIIIDFNFEKILYTDENYDIQECSTTSEINDIEINVSNRILKFIESEDEVINYTYYNAEKDKLTVEEKEGVLKITSEPIVEKWNWFKFERISSKVRTITIACPSTFNGRINAFSTNGNISLDKIDSLEKLDLASTNVTITVENVNLMQDSLFSSTNGGVTLKNLTSLNDIVMTSTNGGMVLNNIAVPKINVDTTNGKITCTDIVCDNLSVRTTNGSVEIKVIGEYEQYEVEVSTTNGSIRVNDLKVGSQIINRGGDKRIKARTTNGSINIKFA